MKKGSCHSAGSRVLISCNTKKAMNDPAIRKLASKGWFKKGNTAWNKGKSVHLSPRSEWKKGDTALDKNKNWKGGLQLPKNDVAHLTLSSCCRVRRPRIVVEGFLGRKLLKSEIVYHLNGDNKDDRIENLAVISRAVLVKINQNKRKVKA